MADLEKCVEELRRLGYKAKVEEKTTWGMDRLRLVIRCQGFNIEFDEIQGISINNCNHYHAFNLTGLRISYGFDERSYFFEMTDEDLIDRVVHYVGEASGIMANLPERLRPKRW